MTPEGYLNPDMFNAVVTVKVDLTKRQPFRNINTNTTNKGRGVPSGSKFKTNEYPFRERREEVSELLVRFQ